MGIKSSVQKHALERGKQIKQELLGRVSRKFKKLQEQISLINPFLKNKIKQSSACELVEMMDNHQTTPLEILLVFIERTATIGIRNNYVLDQMFQEAVIRSKECGQIRKANPHKKSWKMGRDMAECFPPFFGVPVSLKQSILYKDRITYIGHIYPINEIPQKHFLFVLVILKMGFIPFVRSNVPPACKIADTTNNIFGYAQNGWKPNRSCGGSSGGQGGLISCGCSPFGIGSDIGGSSRIPAEWCGLATLKHAFRYTAYGNAFFGKYSAGLPTKSQLSPIARSVEDLIVYFQFICNPQNYGQINRLDRDIYLKQVPFRSQILNSDRKMTLGYYKDIKQLFKTSPANTRVLDECVDILRNMGHTLKQIEIPRLQDVFLQFGRGFLSDDTLQFLEELRQAEPYLKEYSNFYQLSATPLFLKKIIGWVTFRVTQLINKKQPRLSKMLAMSEPQSAVEIVQAVSSDIKIWEREIHEYLADQEVDVWISPGFPIPAIEHGTISNFTIVMVQTICMNALHYPSGGVPVSVVRADELEFDDEFQDKITKATRQSLKRAEGLPVGIQVSALPNHEEEILFIMKQIEQKVQFHRNHVCPTMLQM